ncbi:MAG TPA: carboxylating nicotinate-nucleotide diphosphorylase [Acidimicrobiia bacterium]|nr:carboxylating nicotinate-nucleotide diphosphorylase [Acidimicrobiia bacterium]
MKVEEYAAIVERALREDLGDRGDITSEAVVPAETHAVANLVARTAGVVAGLEVAHAVLATVDPDVEFEPIVHDGDRVAKGTVLARVSGRARSILTAERTALNLLARMSGVATATAQLSEAVAGTTAQITDTRKTMPGLRLLDKYAVTVGGGVNHRMGLYDQVMIKDNHIVAAGGIGAAVAAVRKLHRDTVKVTVEVEDLDQLSKVLESGADRVLLDNMDLEMLREAVGMVGEEMETEASGGVTMETVRAIAETGVDFISVGWITHSAPQLDIALDFL